MVIDNLDVFSDFSPSLLTGLVATMMNQLIPQRLPYTLSHCHQIGHFFECWLRLLLGAITGEVEVNAIDYCAPLFGRFRSSLAALSSVRSDNLTTSLKYLAVL